MPIMRFVILIRTKQIPIPAPHMKGSRRGNIPLKLGCR
jgi:hypothetical protein